MIHAYKLFIPDQIWTICIYESYIPPADQECRYKGAQTVDEARGKNFKPNKNSCTYYS